jgi:flagellar motor switch protein FliN/FliY
VTAWLTVMLGADAFDARVSVPLADLPPTDDSPALSRGGLLALGDAPLAVPLIVATCLASRLDLAALRVGDALMLPSFPLRLAGDTFIGPIVIATATAERGLAGDLAEGGRLVLRTDRLESHPWDSAAEDVRSNQEPSMSAEPNATLEVLEDAPVVVRVELGALEMKAREWASLATGDVVTLGRKLGDPAILRIGGVEVARGELVQVDGEYGVRILGRPGGR